MKRSWIGFILLLVLLALCILGTFAMTRIHNPIEEALNRAADCALEGEWVRADYFFREAQGTWEKWAHFRTCIADHNPVEEIDAAFAMLTVYANLREEAAFAGGCRDLARKTAAVGEAHEPVLWNLL